MSAFFGHDLIFNLNRIRSRALEYANAVPDVQRIAEAGLRVNNEWDVHSFTNRRGVLRNFGKADESKVRQSQKRIRCAGAAEIDSLEAKVLDNERRERVRCTG